MIPFDRLKRKSQPNTVVGQFAQQYEQMARQADAALEEKQAAERAARGMITDEEIIVADQFRQKQ